MTDIRAMTIDDYPCVIGLWRETEFMLLREADSRDSIGRYLERNPGLSFVAFEEGRLVGAVLAGTDGRRGYLQHLSVAADKRGCGLGRELVKRVTDALYKQGIVKTHLFVQEGNDQARAFYDRLGWSRRNDVKMFSYNAGSNPEI